MVRCAARNADRMAPKQAEASTRTAARGQRSTRHTVRPGTSSGFDIAALNDSGAYLILFAAVGAAAVRLKPQPSLQVDTKIAAPLQHLDGNHAAAAPDRYVGRALAEPEAAQENLVEEGGQSRLGDDDGFARAVESEP